MAGGRPPKYKDEFAGQAGKLCKLGATNRDLADFFEVTERTIERWTSEKEEFCRALSIGKDMPDSRIERSLYHRALGYSHPDIDIRVIEGQIVQTEITKHYPPDTKAALAWLYNRRNDKWHPSPDGVTDDDAPSLNIEFIVNPPVGDIKVTKGKAKNAES